MKMEQEKKKWKAYRSNSSATELRETGRVVEVGDGRRVGVVKVGVLEGLGVSRADGVEREAHVALFLHPAYRYEDEKVRMRGTGLP